MKKNKITPEPSPDRPKPQATSFFHQATNSQKTNSHIRQIFKPKFNTAIWRCMTSSDIAYINKKKPKMFSFVSINGLRSENIGLSGLKKLRKALTDSKRVSSLFFDSPDLNGKQLTYLLGSTSHWKNLLFPLIRKPERNKEELIRALLRLGRCKYISSSPLPLFPEQQGSRKLINRISRQLRELNKLQSMSLDIPFSSQTNTLNYRPSRSLETLDLSFRNRNISYEQLSTFVSRLKRCNLLRYLNLSFSKNYSIEPLDAQIWTSFFQNPPCSLKMIKIHLAFNQTQRSEGVSQFLNTIKTLKNIISFDLRLDLPRQPLPFLDILLPCLFANIQGLTQLETLALKFVSFPNIKNEDIQHLVTAFKSLKNLKNTRLDLPPPLFPDESLISFGNSFKQLTSLQILTLSFAKAPPTQTNTFSHQSLQIFSKIIAHLPLTSANLVLGKSKKETKKPILAFSAIKSGLGKLFGTSKNNKITSLTPFFSDVTQLSLLTNLKLGLTSFQISPKEFQSLSLNLKKLKSLEKLHLNLPQFNSKNHFEGLRNLLSGFESIKKLTGLTLIFEEDITNQEVGILSSYLVECQSLTTLNLTFQTATQLNDDSLYFLLGGLRNLSKLKRLFILLQKLSIQDLILRRNQESFGKQAVSHFLQGLTVLNNLSSFELIFNPLSMMQYNKTPLSPDLKGYENMRKLTHFVVDESCYI